MFASSSSIPSLWVSSLRYPSSSRRAIHQSARRLAEDVNTKSSASSSKNGSAELGRILAQSMQNEVEAPVKPEAKPTNTGSGALYGSVMSQSVYRPFQANQTYSPTRLASDSLFRARPRFPKPPLLGPTATKAKQSDPFHILSVNPINEAINPDLVKSYLSQMGKIKSRAETGLTWKNQRRVGKMVRRARAMGLVSRWSDKVQSPQTP